MRKNTIIFGIGAILNLALGLFVRGENQYITDCNFLVAGICLSSIFYEILLESYKNLVKTYADLVDKQTERIVKLITKTN
jgi:hypothetical protein